MPGRVLVVDDIRANVKLLEAHPSRVVRRALRLLRRGSPSSLQSERLDVVLDVVMPDMDGFEVCRRIKASTPTMHVPVVVTALDQTCDKAHEARPDDFITKPRTTSPSSLRQEIWPVSRRSVTR